MKQGNKNKIRKKILPLIWEEYSLFYLYIVLCITSFFYFRQFTFGFLVISILFISLYGKNFFNLIKDLINPEVETMKGTLIRVQSEKSLTGRVVNEVIINTNKKHFLVHIGELPIQPVKQVTILHTKNRKVILDWLCKGEEIYNRNQNSKKLRNKKDYRRKSMMKINQTVTPVSYYIGWITSLFFIVCLIGSIASDQSEIAPAFGIFVLLGMLLIILTPQKITLNNQGIIVVKIYGEYFMKWDDITHVYTCNGNMLIYGDDKCIHIPHPSTWASNPIKQNILSNMFIELLPISKDNIITSPKALLPKYKNTKIVKKTK